MKKLLLLKLLLALNILAWAQTQQGYVKTLGRPNKQGQALSGVTLKVKGSHNTVLSDQNGNFSLIMADLKNGDAYSLQRVQKNGYELNEIDLVGRKLAFSDKVPLTIVMVSSEQLLADKERIESTAYATAQKNYEAKMNLIEEQLSSKEITKEQYQAAINDLQDKFEKYQSLIDGLATHYAHTDFDQLDEKEREINICIENGDLDRADSLLHLLFDPIEDIRRSKEALNNLNKQIEQAQGVITQANADMAAILKQQEKDAEYLYQLYTIAAARFDNDKALQYIETRAELDTYNWKWQFDAGVYCFKQNLINKAETYFDRVLDILLDSTESIDLNTASDDEIYQYIERGTMLFVTENNLATIYSKTNRLAESEELYLEVINFFKGLSQVHPENMLEMTGMGQCLASAQMGLSNLYRQTNRLAESEALSQEAIRIFNKLETNNSEETQIKKAQALMTQGLNYKKNQRYKESEECFQEALELHRRIAKTNPDNEVEVARTLHNYGNLCADTKRYKESEAMYKEGIEIYRLFAKANPQAYEINLASNLSDLANLYHYMQRFEESVQLYKEAFEIYQRLAQSDPKAFGEKLSISKFNLAQAYYKSGKIKESLTFWVEILDEFGILANDNPEKYKKNYEDALIFIKDLAPWLVDEAEDLKNEKKYEESEAYYKNALDMYRWFAKSDPQTYEPEIAMTLNDLGVLYQNAKRYKECETAYKEALEIKRRIAKKGQTEQEKSLAATLNNLAYFYKDKKRYAESERYYTECLEILGRLEQDTGLSMVLYNAGELMFFTREYQKAITYLEEAMTITQKYNDNNSTLQNRYENILYYLSLSYSNIEDHQHSYELRKEYLSLRKIRYESQPDVYRNNYVSAMGGLSYECLFIGHYEEAEQLSRESFAIDESQHWLVTNLAAALLFQGRYNEAEAIYLQYKDELKDNFTDDIYAFRKAEVIPKEHQAEMERIEQLLSN